MIVPPEQSSITRAMLFQPPNGKMQVLFFVPAGPICYSAAVIDFSWIAVATIQIFKLFRSIKQRAASCVERKVLLLSAKRMNFLLPRRYTALCDLPTLGGQMMTFRPEARAAVLRPVCEIENRGCPHCVAQGAVLICRKCPGWHPAASHAIRRIIAMFRRAIQGVRRTPYAIGYEYYVDGDVALLSIDDLHKERLAVF